MRNLLLLFTFLFIVLSISNAQRWMNNSKAPWQNRLVIGAGRFQTLSAGFRLGNVGIKTMGGIDFTAHSLCYFDRLALHSRNKMAWNLAFNYKMTEAQASGQWLDMKSYDNDYYQESWTNVGVSTGLTFSKRFAKKTFLDVSYLLGVNIWGSKTLRSFEMSSETDTYHNAYFTIKMNQPSLSFQNGLLMQIRRGIVAIYGRYNFEIIHFNYDTNMVLSSSIIPLERSATKDVYYHNLSIGVALALPIDFK